MNKKKLGKIQIIIGCFFLVVAVLALIFGIRFMIDGFVDVNLSITGGWGDVSMELNSTNPKIMGHVISDATTNAFVFRQTAILFLVGCTIILLMSIMLITEGMNKNLK
jgi:hypothetical protein